MQWLLTNPVDLSGLELCYIALLGIAVGSFLNLVIVRLPLMLQQQWQQAAQRQLALPLEENTSKINLLIPRSYCDHCQQRLQIKDNIPLLSFLWLRGRTRCCQQAIPYYYPVVEAATALLFVVAARAGYPAIQLLGVWYLLSSLVVLALIDHYHQLLPDLITLPLLWLGLLFNLADYFVTLPQAVTGAVMGYVMLWILFWLVKWCTGREAIGYGDFKLLAALGAWFGWQALPSLLLLATVSGLLFALWQYRSLSLLRHQPIAFGCWLALAATAVLFSNIT
ncbi:prepilin peptidase [Serratia microhaemolytica]|uniref:prepilin peptidase n=1 Tax=Serratia microhaemolytica TaxID=2675110 RepID=UPI000FDD4BA5|nr:A24 family peptidase [Serratia microhaemolytica]